MKLTNIPPIENYSDVIRSLRVCAGEDPKNEGCEGCIFETGSCYNATTLMSRAACVIEDLCELYAKAMEEKKDESMREMQMEADLHTVRPEPMQAEEGLGAASAEDTPLDKLAKDLRAGWEWLSDDMPISPDIRPNMIKAVKVLEIMSGALQMTEVIRVSALAAIGEALK